MQLSSSRTPLFSRLGLAFIVTSTVTIAVMLASLIVSFAYSEQTLPGNLVQQRAANRQHTTTTPRERAFRDVGLQMFQWPWNDIAHECRTSLGTMGIRRVLISPPHENLNIPTWTSSYAPVSYRLDSKLGTRNELRRMVETCHAHGVDIIADAVMNHMAPAIPPFRGIAGSTFHRYSYPGIYTSADFHHCQLTRDGVLHTYFDRGQVQQCDALGLPDLDTGSPHVQQVLHTYLRDLLSVGVDGFRIDAAKHISAADIAGILSVVPADKFVVQEVIIGLDEPIHPQEYFRNGRVFDFAFAGVAKDALHYGDLAGLFSAGAEQGLLPPSQAVPIVTNHDFERDVNLLTYRDGWAYHFTTLLMLATQHGSPFLYSGYAFDSRDQPAPSTPAGLVATPRCAPNLLRPQVGQFLCVQRHAAYRTMVKWRYRAMSGTLQPRHNHTSDIPVLATARIIWRQPGVVALMRNGLLFVANWSGHSVKIPLSPGQTDSTSLISLHAGRVELDDALLTVPQGDIVVSMRKAH